MFFFCRLIVLFLVFMEYKYSFYLSFDFHFEFVVVEVKFGFLCDFLWKKRSFWSFSSSVLGC